MKAAHIPLPPEQRDILMEIVRAQVALVLGKHYKEFDSWAWVEQARGPSARFVRRAERVTDR